MLHNDATCDDCARLLADAADRFRDANERWHSEQATDLSHGDLILQLHMANFTLWHLEDRARDPHATDRTVADVKRGIDKANQARNDLAEQLDTTLLRVLSAADLPKLSAPLHSETPGMMLDRLSILSLKIFHTVEQTQRSDASASHVERNRQRLLVLQQQSDDLADCLVMLWQQVCTGARGYRIYRQMKMYNDPDLNPVLYSAQGLPGRNP